MKRIILACVLILGGCKATVPVPGALNSFDSTAYTTLLTVQAAIEAAKPLATTATTKKLINDAIAAYDTAEAGYLAYHAAAANSTSTPAQQTTLQTQIAAATAASTAAASAVKPTATK